MLSPIRWNEISQGLVIAKSGYLQNTLFPETFHSFLETSFPAYYNWLGSNINFFIFSYGGYQMLGVMYRLIALVGLLIIAIRYWWNNYEWNVLQVFITLLALVGAYPLIDTAPLLGLIPLLLSFIIFERAIPAKILFIVGVLWANFHHSVILLPLMGIWSFLLFRNYKYLLASILAPLITPFGPGIYEYLFKTGGVFINPLPSDNLNAFWYSIYALEIGIFALLSLKKISRTIPYIPLVVLGLFNSQYLPLMSLMLIPVFSLDAQFVIRERKIAYAWSLPLMMVIFYVLILPQNKTRLKQSASLFDNYLTHDFSPQIPQKELGIIMDFQMQRVFAQAEYASLVTLASMNYVMMDNTNGIYNSKHYADYKEILAGNMDLLNHYKIEWVFIEKNKFLLQERIANHPDWRVFPGMDFFLAMRVERSFALRRLKPQIQFTL